MPGKLLPPEPEKLPVRERLRGRNWFTIAALGSLVALVVLGIVVVLTPSLYSDEGIVVMAIVLFAAANVTAILSLHFKDSDL